MKPEIIQKMSLAGALDEVIKKAQETAEYVQRTGKCISCKKRKVVPETEHCETVFEENP